MNPRVNNEGVPPALAMRAIGKRFGATVALAGVDLAVGPGEIHALLGQNGAGKSTLMKILSGALRPDEGAIELAGAPYRPRDPLAGRRAGIGMIYQELSLIPHLSVAENVFLGVEPVRWGVLDRPAMRAGAAAALSELGASGIDPDSAVGSLPIAARQLVEIARALAAGCRVLVLDEPTSSLPKPDAGRLFATMRRLAARGRAIIYITHFLEEALGVADRYSVLRDGRLVASGGTAGVSPPELIVAMIGRPGTDAYPRHARTRGEPVLVVGDLAGSVKPLQASFTLHRGEVIGIFGLVGSGRTELIRAIFGLDPVRRGELRVMGVGGPAGPHDRWVSGVGLVSEDRKAEGLALELSVADNLMMSKPGGAWVTEARQRRATVPLIDRLGVRAENPFVPVSRLSGGNQQKVALGRLLYHDVDVLLLDEPTRGIDVASKSDIYRLIDDLVTRAAPPKAVLMVGNYLPELIGVCDRIAVMHRGVLGEFVAVEETDEHRLLLAASGAAA